MLCIHQDAINGIPYKDIIAWNSDMESWHKESEYLLVVDKPENEQQISKQDVKMQVGIIFNFWQDKEWCNWGEECKLKFDQSKKDSIIDKWAECTMYDSMAFTGGPSAMMSAEGIKARAKENIKAEMRYYNNFIDLSLAVFGAICSESILEEKEKKLAQQVSNSIKIQKHIHQLLEKFFNKVETKVIDEKDRDSLIEGAYSPLQDPSYNISKWSELRLSLEKMPSLALIPFIYNITEDIAKRKNFTGRDRPLTYVFFKTIRDNGKITDRIPEKGEILKKDMRVNIGTVREDFFWASMARWGNVPIWAGPSFTTQVILHVLKDITQDASDDEIRSVAYALFAFWHLSYPQTSTPIHTLFEVMTTASSFISNGHLYCDLTYGSMYDHGFKFSA